MTIAPPKFSGSTLVLIGLLALGWASPGFAQVNEPFCIPNELECDREDFSDFVEPQTVGPNFTSSNGFEFNEINANFSPNIKIASYPNLGFGVEWGCEAMEMVLPQPRTRVTFTFTGFPATINFVAIDPNGGVVDTTTQTNFKQAMPIVLGPAGAPIERVYMWHVDDPLSCQLDCGEPFISSIEACDGTGC